MTVKHEILPVCPRDDHPVMESAATPGYAFCPKCGGGPYRIEDLQRKSVRIEQRLEPPTDGTP